MTITDTVTATYTDVWQWRERSAAWFVIPDTADALAFAVTESGEAVDAYLREIGPEKGYKRNHARPAAMWDELADCFFMCATAMGPGWNTWGAPVWEFPLPRTLAKVNRLLAQSWEEYTDGWRNPVTCAGAIDGTLLAMYHIAMLFSTHGHDLRATVQARLERLEAKHKQGVTL
jgi:hypothetical protein